MTRETTDNLEFLAARLHGRRSRMAEGARLDRLCAAAALPQFASELLPATEVGSARQLQQWLVRELAGEIMAVAAQLAPPGAHLLHWIAGRFQLENLKVLIRGLLAGIPPDATVAHLVSLPGERVLTAEAAAAARSLQELAGLLPRGLVRRRFTEVLALHAGETRPFSFEAALDRGYFEELVVRAGTLGGEDGELVMPLVWQEADTFHLLLVARGRFLYGLGGETLRPFHVRGTGISGERFATMLGEADLRSAARHALGRALDFLPRPPGGASPGTSDIVPADLEALAWNRFLRLANRAFRRSHLGLAAVVAYAELRRVEVANLITLSEGIRGQVPRAELRARVVPRGGLEVAHA